VSCCWLDFPSSYCGALHCAMTSEQQFVTMRAVQVRRVEGTSSLSVGAGLDTGIVEGNPPSFMPFRQARPESRGLFLAPAVRSGTSRQPTARHPSRHGIYPFFLATFFLSLARHLQPQRRTFSKSFLSFRPLSHARFARFVVRETHTDAQTRQAFFSVSIGVLTDEWLREKEGLAAKERSCAPERCCLLIRRLSET